MWSLVCKLFLWCGRVYGMPGPPTDLYSIHVCLYVLMYICTCMLRLTATQTLALFLFVIKRSVILHYLITLLPAKLCHVFKTQIWQLTDRNVRVRTILDIYGQVWLVCSKGNIIMASVILDLDPTYNWLRSPHIMIVVRGFYCTFAASSELGGFQIWQSKFKGPKDHRLP